MMHDDAWQCHVDLSCYSRNGAGAVAVDNGSTEQPSTEEDLPPGWQKPLELCKSEMGRLVRV